MFYKSLCKLFYAYSVYSVCDILRLLSSGFILILYILQVLSFSDSIFERCLTKYRDYVRSSFRVFLPKHILNCSTKILSMGFSFLEFIGLVKYINFFIF